MMYIFLEFLFVFNLCSLLFFVDSSNIASCISHHPEKILFAHQNIYVHAPEVFILTTI